MTHLLVSDQISVPEGKRWQRPGPLSIHILPGQYILALKSWPGAKKILETVKSSCKKSTIKTRVQAQRLPTCSIPPMRQKMYAREIHRSLDELFGMTEEELANLEYVLCQRPLEPCKRSHEPLNRFV
jgi:hypothetical protein